MLRASLLIRKRNQKSRGFFSVGEQDLLLNYELLKSYLVHVVTSKGVPVLSDHKVAFMHISSTYSLHPDVRTKRGGKAEVKEWAHVEAWKLRSTAAMPWYRPMKSMTMLPSVMMTCPVRSMIWGIMMLHPMPVKVRGPNLR
ncbi:hypothetical protein AK812_SmicGene33375 [Symbiodinium microadriaticum]|uniref:Uncharacterized protein n=1 Tax=Symbiodinium microadriaticum TaxID=2951 RepID=A0A1Q9CRS5_SYMMI|nr:hypothetical protein AK812_SmicGene33375 [Symbiodinium microadriaticum]